MSTMTRKRYTDDFKDQAVELVKLGSSIREVALEFGIGKSILHRWCRKAGLGKPLHLGSEGGRAVGESSEADEVKRLRREVADLTLENEILKKAAVILGTHPRAKRGI